MRRLPKRKGVSVGTVAMLMITGLVIASCFMLFPKLVGTTDFRFDARELAVAFDRSYANPASDEARSQGAFAPVNTAQPALPPPTAPPVLTTPPAKLSFRLTAAGTVNIDLTAQKAMTDSLGYHFDELFSLLASEVQGDLTLVTLENTVVSTEKLTDVNTPADVLSSLSAVDFNVLCLGHAAVLNSGINGVIATQEAARAADMTPYGIYTSQAQRDALTILKFNDVSVALLSYQSDLTSASKKKTSKEEQSFAIATPTLPVITADIQKAKGLGAQIVVVSLCWGKEGATSPTQTQRELAQAIADAGADIILGTRSEAVQTVELLTANRGNGLTSQTLCAYSLGNLFTSDRDKRSSISGILMHANVTYDIATGTASFDQLSYTPTYIWRGKKTEKTVYAVLPSDLPPPDFVTGDQLNIMARSLTLIQDVMEETPLAPRVPERIFRDIEN